jgi:hypothetical protein
MSVEETKQKLKDIIIKHYFDGGRGKMTIEALSVQARISRQAIYRFYSDLVPYARGERPVEELLKEGTGDINGLLAKAQARISDLQRQLEQLSVEHTLAIENIRSEYITSLMCSDIALKSSDEIRSTLEKQALHNDKLIREVHRLKLDLTSEKAKQISSAGKANSMPDLGAEIIAVETDLKNAFEDYMATKNRDAFEDAKDRAIENIQKKINNLNRNNDSIIIVFIDRYLSSFSKYVDTLRSKRQQNKVIAVRVPVFSRQELKLFARKLNNQSCIHICIPYCTNDSIVKAQRKFSFRDVPDIEFEAADKMALPSIQDGYAEITFVRIEQGD